MAKSPFKLRSGNSPLFKHVGSSSAGQTRKPYEFKLGPKDTRPVDDLTNKKSTPEKTPPKSKPYVKSGGKATGNIKDYATGSKERYAEYEARGWAHDDTTKGGKPIINNVDTSKQSVAVGPQTAETTAVNEQEFPTKGPVSTTKVTDTKEATPQTSTRYQRRAKRKELKGKGYTRKERKAVVQSMKAETALAKGKEKKARRIAKRVNRKIASKKTRSASDKYLGPTSDRMVDLGL
tara:strand:- start:2644 stop:3348 length:705 start_codon:yes stop_codon:yes gene_type:complete